MSDELDKAREAIAAATTLDELKAAMQMLGAAYETTIIADPLPKDGWPTPRVSISPNLAGVTLFVGEEITCVHIPYGPGSVHKSEISLNFIDHDLAVRVAAALTAAVADPLPKDGEGGSGDYVSGESADTYIIPTAIEDADRRIADLERERDEATIAMVDARIVAAKWQAEANDLAGRALPAGEGEYVCFTRGRFDEMVKEKAELEAINQNIRIGYDNQKASAARLRKAVEDTIAWARSRCPCENEEPNPCPLCGADATKPTDICLSAENTIPRHILEGLTAALQPEPGTDPQPARGEDSPVSANPFACPFCGSQPFLVGSKGDTHV